MKKGKTIGLVEVDEQLAPAIREIIERMVAAGDDYPFDFPLVARMACIACYGGSYSERQLSDATHLAVRMCAKRSHSSE